MVMVSYPFELLPYLPEWMTDSTVPLQCYGNGEVDGPGQPHLGHGQEHGDHAQVGGVGPEEREQAWHADDDDGQLDIHEVKCSKGKHKLVEVLGNNLAREPDDADGVANNTKASDKQLKLISLLKVESLGKWNLFLHDLWKSLGRG